MVERVELVLHPDAECIIRERFGDQATDYRLRTHVASEMQQFDQDETKSFVQNITNHAIANADTPAIVSMDLAQVVEKTEAFGRRNGLGKERTAELVPRVSRSRMGDASAAIKQRQDLMKSNAEALKAPLAMAKGEALRLSRSCAPLATSESTGLVP